MTKLSALTAKTTLVGADQLVLTDSEASSATKKITLTNTAVGLQALLNRPGVFIAASNASAAEIAYALAANRCDGTADQTEINTALAAGGDVYLSSGTFTLSATLTDGGGSAKVFARPDTTIKMVNAGNLDNLLLISTIDGFEWHGGIFDGNKANNTTTGAGLIQTSGACNNILLEGITVKDSDARGIQLAGTGTLSNPMIVRNCVIKDCDEQGIQTTRDYTVIEGCEISGCGTETVDGSDGAHQAIKVISNHCTIHNNRISRTGGKGIEIAGSSASDMIHGVNITDNDVYLSTRIGIYCHFTTQAVITGNHTYGNENNGIDCNNCAGTTITGNNCSFNGSPRGTSSLYSREGNGIFIYKSQDTTITGNMCQSNSQGQIAGDARSGVRITAETTDLVSTIGTTIVSNICNDRRLTDDFTCQLNGAINDTVTSIAVDTLSSATMQYDGHFTLLIDSEAVVVTSPTTDSDNNLTAGTWTVIRARGALNANNLAASHTDNSPCSRQATQKYGVEIKTLDDDEDHVDYFIVTNNIVTPNRTGTVFNDYGTSATKVVSGNI